MTDTIRPRIRYWIPEAYVSEEGLRSDVRSFARRGFGGVEVVSCNFFGLSVPEECRWGSERFYDALRIICEEARACGLAVDIANGPQWPIAAPQIASADDPAALYELTFGAYEVNAGEVDGLLSVPEPRVTHDEGTPVLEAACAYRLAAPGVLDEASYVDLLPSVQGDAIAWCPAGQGTWMVFAFWGQPACHKIWDRYYVIDHLSRAGAEASVAWWRETLLPALGEAADVVESFFCDSLEWKVSMDWTRGFADAFQQRFGYDLRRYLPVVGEARTYPKSDVPGFCFADEELARAVRRDYAAMLSHLYQEEHLRVLSEGAAALGKTVRYQVAYNKPLCEEDAAAFVAIPETESFNRPSLDNLRTMAGAAHLTRKERISFEGAAEGGNGYGQTQGDLLWWLKRAAIAGVSAQVLHGAGYCGAYGDGWVPGLEGTGFEAFGTFVSNYWNRTLSERSMAEMCAAITRLNALRRLQPQVDLAFLRETYLNNGHGGDGSFHVRDGGLLESRGYSYEFLSPALLRHSNARVVDGVLDPEGAAYRALVVAGQEGLTTETLTRLAELAAAGLLIFVVGDEQLRPYAFGDVRSFEQWSAACEAFLLNENVLVMDTYRELVAALREQEIEPAVSYQSDRVFSAHVRDGEEELFLLYNGNRVAFGDDDKLVASTCVPALTSDSFEAVQLEAELAGAGVPFRYDLATGKRYRLAYERSERGVRVTLPLEGDELCAVGLGNEAEASALPAWSYNLSAQALGPWDVSLNELTPYEKPTELLWCFREVTSFKNLDTPTWNDELPGSSEHFAGYAEWHCAFDLQVVPTEARLRLPEWSDALTLDVNGAPVPVVAGFGHEVDVRDALRAGANDLTIRVYTNLRNRRVADQPAHRFGLNGAVELLLG